MKKALKLLGLAALVAAIGFSTVGCDNGNDVSGGGPNDGPPGDGGGVTAPSIAGTWVNPADPSESYVFNTGGTGIWNYDGEQYAFNFTVSGNTVTLSSTHDDDKVLVFAPDGKSFTDEWGDTFGKSGGGDSQFNPNITYGTFTDTRGSVSQTYRTVVMPDGKRWMAENLNYKNSSWSYNDVADGVQLNVGDKGSWCYDNSADSCAKYGRLYTWAAAMEACPAGWHLPSDAEWGALMVAVNPSCSPTSRRCLEAGTKLKSSGYWNSSPVAGTNQYGFSALPGGGRIWDGYFNDAGFCGYWWSATEYDADDAYYRYMYNDIDYVDSSYDFKRRGSSVRCIRVD